MKKGKRILILILTFCLALNEGYAQENETKKQIKSSLSGNNKDSFPEPIGYVNDFESIFTNEQNENLEKIIDEYEKQTTREISIITIERINPYDNIANFSNSIANNWGVGKAGKNNGLVIVFSKSLGEIYISTGLGTEEILTDEICMRVIYEEMIPKFREKDYYSGIKKGLETLITKWN